MRREVRWGVGTVGGTRARQRGRDESGSLKPSGSAPVSNPVSLHRAFPMSIVRLRRFALLAAAVPVAVGASASPLAAQPPVVTPAGYRADVAQLRQLMLDVEKSWTSATRAVAVARLDSLAAAADTISAVAFELAVARIVATADNGHTTVPAARRANRFNRVGVRLAPLDGEFVVMRARAAVEELLGARLVAVESRPVSELRAAVHRLHGGTAAWRDRFVPFTLESPEILRAMGLVPQSTGATYRFALADGRTVERRLEAEPADSTRPRQGSQRWFFGEPLGGDTTDWRILRTPAQLPWSLQEPGVPFRLRAAPEIDAIVIELRQNNNSPNMPIARFLDSARTVIERVKPRHVVLDMRFNGGGDLNTTRDFMRELPRLVPGRVFALTSPYTFSAAISSVGYLKQSAPDRVTVVGEEVGDRLEMFAEGRPVTLTHSGIMVGTATERHDYMNGCRAHRDCHGSVVRNPIAVPTLAPDVSAPWTREAYLAGRDPGMDAVAARVAADRRM
jgi:hypothetical protein